MRLTGARHKQTGRAGSRERRARQAESATTPGAASRRRVRAQKNRARPVGGRAAAALAGDGQRHPSQPGGDGYPHKTSIYTPHPEGANGDALPKFFVCKPQKTDFCVVLACTVSYGLPYALLC